MCTLCVLRWHGRLTNDMRLALKIDWLASSPCTGGLADSINSQNGLTIMANNNKGKKDTKN